MLQRLMDLKASGLHSCVGVEAAALCHPVRKTEACQQLRVRVTYSMCVCVRIREFILVCKQRVSTGVRPCVCVCV